MGLRKYHATGAGSSLVTPGGQKPGEDGILLREKVSLETRIPNSGTQDLDLSIGIRNQVDAALESLIPAAGTDEVINGIILRARQINLAEKLFQAKWERREIKTEEEGRDMAQMAVKAAAILIDEFQKFSEEDAERAREMKERENEERPN